MKLSAWTILVVWLAGSTVATSAQAQTARDLLTQASFSDADEATAVRRVSAAHAAATNRLRHQPGDREAALMQATALGYRAKLTGSRGDAIAARKAMEALVQRAPDDPERHLALGAWHLGAVHRLGRVLAGAALGASKSTGIGSLDRAVALGGDRATFPGLAALLRLQLDPADTRGRALAEAAVRGAAPTPLDRHLQRAAALILVPARAGNAAATRKLAARLLPLGRFEER